MLKGLIGVVLAGAVLTTSPLTASVREGFYCGLGLGDSIEHYSQKVSGGRTVTRSRTSDHLLGTVFVGWGRSLCDFYVGGEIGTYFPKRSITIERPGAVFQNSTFLTTTDVQDFVTGDILLGFRPNETLLCYLRGGAAYSRLSFVQFTNEFEGIPSRDREKAGAAWRLGGGVNCAITSCFGIGLDYIFTSYPDLHFTTSNNADFKIKAYANYIGVSGIVSF